MRGEALIANVTAEEYNNALQRWVANSARRAYPVNAVLVAKNQITGRCEVLHKSFGSPQTIASLPASTTHVVFFGQPLQLVADALNVPLDKLKSDVSSELDKFMEGVLSRIIGAAGSNLVITTEDGRFVKFVVHRMAMLATLCSEKTFRAIQKEYTVRDFVLMLTEEVKNHFHVVITDIKYSTHAVDVLLSEVGDCMVTLTTDSGNFFRLNIPVLCDESLQRMSCIQMEVPAPVPATLSYMERIQEIVREALQFEAQILIKHKNEEYAKLQEELKRVSAERDTIQAKYNKILEHMRTYMN